MKTVLILLMGFVTPMLFGQKVIEKRMSFDNKNKVVLDLQITDSINIQTWNKNEVYVYATVNINNNKDNEVYETSFNEADDKVEVTAKFKKDYFRGKNCCCQDSIAWKIMVPENIELSVKTINGNIIIAGKVTSVKANSISGFIDLGIPSDKQADLELKTITGTIYSDLKLASNSDKRVVELKLKDKFNGGGAPINLETISGDIFLRNTK
jgi:hypothetical protein